MMSTSMTAVALGASALAILALSAEAKVSIAFAPNSCGARDCGVGKDAPQVMPDNEWVLSDKALTDADFNFDCYDLADNCGHPLFKDDYPILGEFKIDFLKEVIYEMRLRSESCAPVGDLECTDCSLPPNDDLSAQFSKNTDDAEQILELARKAKELEEPLDIDAWIAKPSEVALKPSEGSKIPGWNISPSFEASLGAPAMMGLKSMKTYACKAQGQKVIATFMAEDPMCYMPLFILPLMFCPKEYKIAGQPACEAGGGMVMAGRRRLQNVPDNINEGPSFELFVSCDAATSGEYGSTESDRQKAQKREKYCQQLEQKDNCNDCGNNCAQASEPNYPSAIVDCAPNCAA